MKTYKTWEVIKMLGENPKLKFEAGKESIGIEKNKLMWIGSDQVFKLTTNSNIYNDTFNKTWTLVHGLWYKSL